MTPEQILLTDQAQAAYECRDWESYSELVQALDALIESAGLGKKLEMTR